MNDSIEAMPPRRYARAAKRAAELAHELAQKAGRKVSPTIQYLVDTSEDEIARRRRRSDGLIEVECEQCGCPLFVLDERDENGGLWWCDNCVVR